MGADVSTYSFDARGQLANSTLFDGTTIDNTYDHLGQRVQQSIDRQVTNYLWDEFSRYGDVALESDSSGTTQASYVLGNGQLVSQTRAGATNYYLADAQGSTRALTDSSGGVTDSYSQTGTTTNSYLYTGQQYDSNSGLYSLRARYYNPGIGRFLSRDTYPVNYGNPVEMNRYAYAANSPINYSDPSGYGALSTFGKIVVTAVAIVSINVLGVAITHD